MRSVAFAVYLRCCFYFFLLVGDIIHFLRSFAEISSGANIALFIASRFYLDIFGKKLPQNLHIPKIFCIFALKITSKQDLGKTFARQFLDHAYYK